MARNVLQPSAKDLGTTSAPAPNPVADQQAALADAINGNSDAPVAPRPNRPFANRPHAKSTVAASEQSDSAGDEVSTIPRRTVPIMTSQQRIMADTLNAVNRVDELEEQLRSGHAVVDLDPSTVDASFVPDRMAPSDEAHKELVRAIKADGQIVPILVRPHPQEQGRYQVAYGHRRLRAVTELGIKVRAVIRELTDEQLVVAQGQENNARTNLSFIEKARFALQLQERRFRRDVIMQALCVDRPRVSQMISIASSIPMEIIDAIGPAPSIGRRKWEDFSALIKNGGVDKVRHAIERAENSGRDSDAKFEAAYKALTTKAEAARPELWTAPDGARLARYTETDDKFSLIIDRKLSPRFGKFLVSRLEQLYNDFQAADKE
jgi:ParB family transcriptional regulator, chromosome partitioning protein